jgi:hypothetical protein
VLRNVYKDVTLKRFGAKRQKKGIKGEPDLRGEPAVSSAEKSFAARKLYSGLERSDTKNDGLRKQAVKV